MILEESFVFERGMHMPKKTREEDEDEDKEKKDPFDFFKFFEDPSKFFSDPNKFSLDPNKIFQSKQFRHMFKDIFERIMRDLGSKLI